MELIDHYRWCLRQLELKQWEAAEGRLLWLRHQLGPTDQDIADALAYALLMQGAYEQCVAVLTPVLDSPKRSFWIHHKYADAKRGLHQLRDAVKHYQQAVLDGSTSQLTIRNLLEVLFALDPREAIEELGRWQEPLQDEHIQGVTSAAMAVPGLDIARWLQERSLANSAIQRRLMEADVLTLNMRGLEEISACAKAHAMSEIEHHDEHQDGEQQRWLDAIHHRLKRLAVLVDQPSD